MVRIAQTVEHLSHLRGSLYAGSIPVLANVRVSGSCAESHGQKSKRTEVRFSSVSGPR